MNLKPTFLAYLLGLSGLIDFVLVALIVSSAVAHGISRHPIAISLFGFTISLLLLSAIFALKMAFRGQGFPFTKPVLVVASIVHVVLGLLIQLGPGALYQISAFVFVGTVYFLSSFKVPKPYVQAT